MSKMNGFTAITHANHRGRTMHSSKQFKNLLLCGLVIFGSEGCATLASLQWNGGSNSDGAPDYAQNNIPVYTGKGQVVSPSQANGH
jgi:hypothetical protein